jgi:hypothetical protein
LAVVGVTDLLTKLGALTMAKTFWDSTKVQAWSCLSSFPIQPGTLRGSCPDLAPFGPSSSQGVALPSRRLPSNSQTNRSTTQPYRAETRSEQGNSPGCWLSWGRWLSRKRQEISFPQSPIHPRVSLILFGLLFAQRLSVSQYKSHQLEIQGLVCTYLESPIYLWWNGIAHVHIPSRYQITWLQLREFHFVAWLYESLGKAVAVQKHSLTPLRNRVNSRLLLHLFTLSWFPLLDLIFIKHCPDISRRRTLQRQRHRFPWYPQGRCWQTPGTHPEDLVVSGAVSMALFR